jgi:hypothetical protein
MVDHSLMRLGKKAPKRDLRTLMLAKYTTALPPSPSVVDWSGKINNLGVMLNNNLGDCTCAGIGHIIQTWTSQTTGQVIVSDADILNLYEKACGYNPADPSTDQGGVEIDVLNYWKSNPISNHALDAYCAIDTSIRDDVYDSIWLFGAAYIGVALPISAQTQETWDVAGDGKTGSAEPGSWGGHAVPVVAVMPEGLICITWGQFKHLTWNFWHTYCDEAYACLSKDWAVANGKAPSGFDWAALDEDLKAL